MGRGGERSIRKDSILFHSFSVSEPVFSQQDSHSTTSSPDVPMKGGQTTTYVLRIFPVFQRFTDRAQFANLLRNRDVVVLNVGGGQLRMFGCNTAGSSEENGRELGLGVICGRITRNNNQSSKKLFSLFLFLSSRKTCGWRGCVRRVRTRTLKPNTPPKGRPNYRALRRSKAF